MLSTRATDSAMHLRRTLNFFDAHSSHLPEEPRQLLASATCITHVPPHARSERGTLLLGLSDGTIAILDAQTFEKVAQWNAHGSKEAPGKTTTVKFAAEIGIIVSIGQQPSFRFPHLRVWTWPNGAPSLLGHARIQHGADASPVTVLEVHPALIFIAIGLQDGKVLIIRDVADTLDPGDQSSSLLRVKVVRDATNVENSGSVPDTVTGLTFAQDTAGENARTLYLLIVTISRTLRYTVLGTGACAAIILLDDTGCELNCTCSFAAPEVPSEMASDVPTARGATEAARYAATHMSNKVVLACEESLYVIGPTGREGSIALEGPKQSIHGLHGQMAVISDKDNSRKLVTIFDLDTKVVTHTTTVTNVQAVWWMCIDDVDRVMIVGDDVLELRERPLNTRLEQLFRKDLYLVAAQFAYASAVRFPAARLPTVPPAAFVLPRRPNERIIAPLDALVGDIYRRYGDHMYDKRDFGGAVAQFIKTVGIVSPSYVIRKFLEAQRLPYLASYLQALHDIGEANADHTTLLLNCYTKLQDTDALDRFIRTPVSSEGPAAQQSSLPFDLETAISVCRRGGFFKHAAFLAEKYKHHSEYLSIKLRDEHKTTSAIAYISVLSPAEAEIYVHKYAGVLLDGDLDNATDLLIRLYTRKEPARLDNDGSVSLEYLSPVPIFPHFVSYPEAFCRFLEAVATQRRTDPEPNADAAIINDTLLELYLELQQYQKAKKILEDRETYPYTVPHALMLCSTEGYTDGLVCVYEKLHMVDELVQFWIDKALATGCDDTSQDEHASCRVMEVLARYCSDVPHLHITVLEFLISRHDILQRHEREFQQVLAYINEHALLSPLEVVELIGKTETVTIGMMSDYLRGVFESEEAETKEINTLITSYRAETQKKSTELEELTSTTIPRVFENQHCGICGGVLDLPRVHFMCKHSFHLSCLGDGDEGRECPLCTRAHEVIREVRQGNAMLSDYNFVISELHTGDGFQGIADLLGKGIL